jgi:hypothetical protein
MGSEPQRHGYPVYTTIATVYLDYGIRSQLWYTVGIRYILGMHPPLSSHIVKDLPLLYTTIEFVMMDRWLGRQTGR